MFVSFALPPVLLKRKPVIVPVMEMVLLSGSA